MLSSAIILTHFILDSHRTATSATAQPHDRIRTGGTADSTATVSTDPTRTGRTKEADGLPAREGVHSPKFVTLRSTDTVHTEKRRGFSHVHRLPRTEQGYHQVPLSHPTSRRTDRPTAHSPGFLENRPSRRLPPDPRQPTRLPETAFRTRYGSFEYTVTPCGLTNVPATFQMTMNEAFCPLLDKCVIVYLDDVLIYSIDRAQHLQDIEAVFKIRSENRLLTKAFKCESLQDRLDFLGHVISADGVEIDPKKIATIQAWHASTNLTELQSFLGFVNYVLLFVSNMAKLTAPLTDLLRKGVEYTWGEKEQAAFSALKKKLCSLPVLRIAYPHRPFELITDASDIAVGAVLLQDFGNGLQPIAYESHKLHLPKRNYPIHDREMLAIVHAFKAWQCYLTGADVTVRTDHCALQYLRAQPNLNPRQTR
ncbi:unnamed protein product [Closterium sp. NIES-53]